LQRAFQRWLNTPSVAKLASIRKHPSLPDMLWMGLWTRLATRSGGKGNCEMSFPSSGLTQQADIRVRSSAISIASDWISAAACHCEPAHAGPPDVNSVVASMTIRHGE